MKKILLQHVRFDMATQGVMAPLFCLEMVSR